MTKERLGSSSNVVKLNDLISMMYFTTESNEVMFNKPFESLVELREFFRILSNYGVMDTRLLSPEGEILTQEDCIGRDYFILSKEAITLCTKILKFSQPNTRTLLTSGTEEQVSLILKRSEKIA